MNKIVLFLLIIFAMFGCMATNQDFKNQPIQTLKATYPAWSSSTIYAV
jgi:hypothetical protein